MQHQEAHKRNIFKQHLSPIKRLPPHRELERRVQKAQLASIRQPQLNWSEHKHSIKKKKKKKGRRESISELMSKNKLDDESTGSIASFGATEPGMRADGNPVFKPYKVASFQG